MSRKKSSRKHVLMAGSIAVGAIVLVFAVTAGLSRAFVHQDTILPKVVYTTTSLGGLTVSEAEEALAGAIQDPGTSRITFLAGNQTFDLAPGDIGYEVSNATIATAAYDLGRTGRFSERYGLWWKSRFAPIILTNQDIGSYDAAQLEAIFDAWDKALPDANGGAISLEGTELTMTAPRSGIIIDRTHATEEVLNAFVIDSDEAVTLSVVEVLPPKSANNLEATYEQTKALLADGVTLTAGDKKITISRAQLAKAISFATDETSGEYQIILDRDAMKEWMEPVSARDAWFDTKNIFSVTVIPGQEGYRVDYAKTEQAIINHDFARDRMIDIAHNGTQDPDFTTKEAEDLDIDHMIAEFTTYHPCCAARVGNIHRFADLINDTLVLPGERFNLNTAVGERTTELGFNPAGTIVGGEIVDTVGGGISQFATTFYNAVFWAGIPNITHKPHSFYFPRYPEGIEATMSWPSPTLVFTNTQKNGLLIQTAYTDTSITVRVFGSNDGRVFAGSHSDKQGTWLRLLRAGGANSYEVTASVSERYNIKSAPTKVNRVPDAKLACGVEKVTQEAHGGWSVDVVRVITKQGGDPITEKETVVYSPSQKYVHVGVCE